jgi:transcriptional regulator with XRE-family HTH domain
MTPDTLKTKRKGLGLSQTALARALGLHLRTIAGYELGHYPVPRHVALAVAYLETANPME